MKKRAEERANSGKKKKSIPRRILKGVGIVLLILVLFVVALFGFLTITEYKPKAVETVEVEPGSAAGGPGAFTEDSLREAASGKREITVVTWNIGYGALGDNADFFMDGGKGVKTADEARVRANLAEIGARLRDISPDVIFLQEVDVRSSRSSRIDETEYYEEEWSSYDSAFATNYKVPFVPYPVPPIGKVNAGIETLSALPLSGAERIALPCPFSWPFRLGNLKRCLLISRVDLPDTDRELVLINLHLEAYDDGEGKAAQTAVLKEYLEAEASKGNYVIAGGDFNQTFSTVDPALYPAQEGKWQAGAIDAAEFGGNWQFVMDEKVPTCRSLDQPYEGADHGTFQYYMIDGFILSDNVELVSVETGDAGFTATDHNPVCMKVRLAG